MNVHETSDVCATAFCGALRTKRYFMLDVIATDASQYVDESGQCWCYHTQQVVGPDGELVRVLDCVPDRGCYRSALKPLGAV